MKCLLLNIIGNTHLFVEFVFVHLFYINPIFEHVKQKKRLMIREIVYCSPQIAYKYDTFWQVANTFQIVASKLQYSNEVVVTIYGRMHEKSIVLINLNLI